MQKIEFTSVYQQYAPQLLRLCEGYASNNAEAQDLLQETFIKVWQNLDKFRGDSKISTWLYRVTVNTCLGHIKKKKNKETETIDGNINIAEENEGAKKEDEIKMLQKAIHALPEGERLIITMVLEELPYDEIAEILQITEGNLRVKIHRIKQQLTKLYFTNENFQIAE